MKKLITITMLISSFSFGQFFEDHEEDNSSNGNASFTDPHYGNDPDQGVDLSPGNPGDETPIDDWLFLLPIAGIAIGAFYIQRRKKLA